MGTRDNAGRKIYRASSSPASVDLALDSIAANEIEREVVHLVCRVHGARSALRVVAGFRVAKQE